MKRTLKGTLLLLWMALIFFLSAQPQQESAQTSNRAAVLIYLILSFFSKDLDPAGFMLRYAALIRKLAHFTEFLILGIMVLINVREYRKEKTVLPAVLFSVFYAISDELHQLFVAGRCCDVRDMLIDSAGALCGILLCHFIMQGCRKK